MDGHAIGVYGLAGPHCSGSICDVTKAANAAGGPITDTPPTLEANSGGHSYYVAGWDTATGAQCGPNPSADVGCTLAASLTGQVQDAGVMSNTVSTPALFFTTPNPVGGSASFMTIGDGSFAYANPWSSQQPAKLSYKLPNNFVPEGSLVEGIHVKIRHAEPSTGAGGTPVVSATVTLSPSAGGCDYFFPNTDGCPTTVSETVTPCVNQVPVYSGVPTAYDPNNNANWCTWTSDDDGTGLMMAQLTDGLNNGAALDGGTVQIQAKSIVTAPHQMYVDGVEVTVDYRPPGQLRPLSGCLTIRTADVNGATTYRGTSFIHNGALGGGDYLSKNDYASYDTNGGISSDVGSCPLVVLYSEHGDTTSGSKIHLAGDFYAPSASIDLSGRANEVPFVTDGVVARQITARRWSQGPDLPTFGLYPGYPHLPREVTLTAKDSAENTVATAHLILTDSTGGGSTAEIVSWQRMR